jgi:hypothetical protein
MTLPASGPLTFSDIQTEFGGTNPIALGEYYAGGGLVPAGTSGTYGAVPSSGALSVQNFYGTTAFTPVYIEEVFSTYLYTGTGSAQTITNGIDLSTKGGLTWIKDRFSTAGPYHALFDTNRGAGNVLSSNSTDATNPFGSASTLLTSFGASGFSLGTDSYQWVNKNTNSYVSWSFRKQPKFYTQGTYTGTGSVQNIAHDLGATPGFIIIKGTNNNYAWVCYHRSLGATQFLALNSTQEAITTSTPFNNTEPTSSNFTVGTSPAVNESGKTFVYYAFAHNAGGFGAAGTDNVISCGSFSTNGAGSFSVNLGYEPQWVMIKSTIDAGTSTIRRNWIIYDTMRNLQVQTQGQAARLIPNLSDAESSSNEIGPTATGFESIGNQNPSAGPYIYIAIRRGPMKVPTVGTSVFAPFYASYSEGAAITTNFPIDLSMWKGDVTYNWSWQDRLRGTPTSTGSGGPALACNSTIAETTSYAAVGITKLDSNTRGSVSYQADSGRSNASAYFMLRRAPSFFDEVCYTGTGSAQNVTHNLTVAPELVIIKSRSNGGSGYGWVTGSSYYPSWGRYIPLNTDDAVNGSNNAGPFNNTAPTSSVFTVNTWSETNNSGSTYVAYLFATCAGVSKVGSYTGNGSTQQINCGFTSGARFVMIKRTDSAGDWIIYSSALGIVAGNDRTVLFNSSNASSAFGDTLDAFSSGFELGPNSALFNINSNGGTYIFLAIA